MEVQDYPALLRQDGITVVGMGAIGKGVARLFASCGFKVQVVTRGGEDRFRSSFSKELSRGTITIHEVEEICSRVAFTTLDGAQSRPLVIEAVPEDLEIKKEILKSLEEKQRGDWVLASSTSTIPIALISADLTRPDNFIGMHFNTPVHVMELVEVIPSSITSSRTLKRILETCATIAKTPAIVRDFPGFVASRLAHAITQEAVRIYRDGVADPETIDLIARKALNFPVGPFRLLDEVGLDIAVSGAESLALLLGDNRYVPEALLRQMTYENKLGRKAGEGFYKYPSI